jgi:hypothetical protein
LDRGFLDGGGSQHEHKADDTYWGRAFALAPDPRGRCGEIAAGLIFLSLRGTARTSDMDREKAFDYLVGIVTLAAVAIVSFSFLQGSPAPVETTTQTVQRRDPGPPPPALTAHVLHGARFFRISNKDTFGWRDCDFDLNDEFQYKAPIIRANDSIEVPEGHFAKKNGERFNSLRFKPLRMVLYCRDTPRGILSSVVTWR